MSVPSTPGFDRRPTDQMTLEELRHEFINQKVTQFQLHAEAEALKDKIESLRGESVRLQQNAEIEEEHAANQLFRRLDGAERDVRKYQVLLKEEEESTGKLRQQIRDVRMQQSEVENQLEQQEEYLLLELQKKLLHVANKKSELERELQAERQRYLEVLVNQLAVLRGAEAEAAASAAGAAVEGSTQTPDESGAAPEKNSPASPSSPTTGQFDATAHAKVVQLEQRLNKLLTQHAEAMKESAETEQRCAELSKKLTDIQNATFLDRARAAKLKEELKEARTKLSDLETNAGDASSYDDNSSFNTPVRSLDQSTLNASASMSLKERTKELLSLAHPPSASHEPRQL